MLGIGVIEILILSVLGLGCIGAVVAGVVAATSGMRRGESPQQPLVPCPHCGAIRPAADRFCGACGQSLPGPK